MKRQASILLLWVFVAGANLLPLVNKYLPFTDLQGHAGLVGALAHLHDPEARIGELYAPNLRLLTSMLFEALGWMASAVMPIPLFTNLFLGIFCILGFPLCMLALLRAYGRDGRLALLLFPLVYYRCVWFGFINYVAAVPLVLLGLALLRRYLDAQQQQQQGAHAEQEARSLLGLALLAVLLVLGHFFAALVFFGLTALVLLHEQPARRAIVRLAVALLPSIIYLGYGISGFPTSTGSPKAPFKSLLFANRRWTELPQQFVAWSIRGYQRPLDRWVLGATALSMVAALIHAWRRSPPAQLATRKQLQQQPLLLLGAALGLFILFPTTIDTWWAVNVRFVPFIWAFALLCIPAPAQPTPLWLLAPALVAAMLWGGYLAWDFRSYNRGELAGFDAALDDIPKGRLVQALWPRFSDENHYSQFPMAHLANHYVVRRGGLVCPMLGGAPRQIPIAPRHKLTSVAWGRSESFSYRQHGADWEYFLVKAPQPGRPPLPPIFADAPPDAVTLISQHGLWSVYKNNRPVKLIKPTM